MVVFLLENFSHSSQLISQVYSSDDFFSRWIALIGFLPAGVFVILFAYFTRLQSENLWFRTGMVLFGYAYGLGTIITSFFPCAGGCIILTTEPNSTQIVHQITLFLTYTLTPLAMLFFAVGCYEYEERFLKRWSYLTGLVLSFLSFDFLFTNDYTNLGLKQRIIELLIMLWVTIISVHYYKISKQENITFPKN